MRFQAPENTTLTHVAWQYGLQFKMTELQLQLPYRHCPLQTAETYTRLQRRILF